MTVVSLYDGRYDIHSCQRRRRIPVNTLVMTTSSSPERPRFISSALHPRPQRQRFPRLPREFPTSSEYVLQSTHDIYRAKRPKYSLMPKS